MMLAVDRRDCRIKSTYRTSFLQSFADRETEVVIYASFDQCDNIYCFKDIVDNTCEFRLAGH